METVLQFDEDSLRKDVRVIDNVQHFLSKVRTALNDHAGDLTFRTKEDGLQVKFIDFIAQALSIFHGFDDSSLQKSLRVIDRELRKYYYRGCKVYELLAIEGFRRLLSNSLDELQNTPVQKLKNTIADVVRKIETRDFIKPHKVFIEHVNSLYSNNDTEKFVDFLMALETLKSNPTKSTTELMRTFRSGIRNTLFDHYSNLNTNARKDLQLKIIAFLLHGISHRSPDAEQVEPEEKESQRDSDKLDPYRMPTKSPMVENKRGVKKTKTMMTTQHEQELPYISLYEEDITEPPKRKHSRMQPIYRTTKMISEEFDDEQTAQKLSETTKRISKSHLKDLERQLQEIHKRASSTDETSDYDEDKNNDDDDKDKTNDNYDKDKDNDDKEEDDEENDDNEDENVDVNEVVFRSVTEKTRAPHWKKEKHSKRIISKGHQLYDVIRMSNNAEIDVKKVTIEEYHKSPPRYGESYRHVWESPPETRYDRGEYQRIRNKHAVDRHGDAPSGHRPHNQNDNTAVGSASTESSANTVQGAKSDESDGLTTEDREAIPKRKMALLPEVRKRRLEEKIRGLQQQNKQKDKNSFRSRYITFIDVDEKNTTPDSSFLMSKIDRLERELEKLKSRFPNDTETTYSPKTMLMLTTEPFLLPHISHLGPTHRPLSRVKESNDTDSNISAENDKFIKKHINTKTKQTADSDSDFSIVVELVKDHIGATKKAKTTTKGSTDKQKCSGKNTTAKTKKTTTYRTIKVDDGKNTTAKTKKTTTYRTIKVDDGKNTTAKTKKTKTYIPKFKVDDTSKTTTKLHVANVTIGNDLKNRSSRIFRAIDDDADDNYLASERDDHTSDRDDDNTDREDKNSARKHNKDDKPANKQDKDDESDKHDDMADKNDKTAAKDYNYLDKNDETDDKDSFTTDKEDTSPGIQSLKSRYLETVSNKDITKKPMPSKSTRKKLNSTLNPFLRSLEPKALISADKKHNGLRENSLSQNDKSRPPFPKRKAI